MEQKMNLTDNEKHLVTTTFNQIAPDAEHAARQFYDRLFTIAPEFRPLFKDTDMREQSKKFIQMIAIVVYGLDDVEKLSTSLRDMGMRHVNYGVKLTDYSKVGEAFLWMLEQQLDADYTADVEAAWLKAYTMITTTATEHINT
jgi:hemoglobin-like flavoprotein